MSRRAARDTAFRLFYEYAAAGAFNPATMDVMRDCFDKGMNDLAWAYVKDVIEKFDAHQAEVDALIETHAKGWKISHMAKVELSILRLGITEIRYSDDISERVTINECVDLAKKYASEKSSKFINGVLAAVVLKEEGEADGG